MLPYIGDHDGTKFVTIWKRKQAKPAVGFGTAVDPSFPKIDSEMVINNVDNTAMCFQRGVFILNKVLFHQDILEEG